MSRRSSLSASSSNHVDPGSHPGFINLGNTCFLNTVLQASSATQSLKQLLHPDEALDEHDLEVLRSNQSSLLASDKGAVHDLLSSELIKQLSARSKSPVLQLVDEENRKAWSLPGSRRPSSNLESSLIASTLLNSKPSDEAIASTATSTRSSIDARSFEPTTGDLPLTTAFRQVLDKTWLDQERSNTSKSKSNRGKAPVVNPKKLLNIMASKYDQYGAYGQQDAHELLRHLLDSLRMEELDVIKKMNPPDTRGQKKRHRRLSMPNGQVESKEKDMQPFVDSIFCGKLLSCVVCEGCRHVSHCYEDFYDLSLSLRHETDVKSVGKRDRMRSMADRWRRATSGKAASGSPSRMTAGDSLALMTDGLTGSVSDTEEGEEKVKRSSSRSGRSIARPKSAAAGQNPAVIDANSRDSAKTFMMKNLQPKGLVVNELEMDKLTIDSKKEEEKRGTTSLFRAVSGRSRPSSRAASPIRDEIKEVVEGDQQQSHHHHHHHILRHERKPKQSKQGAYLAKLLTEAVPPAPIAQTSALLWGRKASIPLSSDSRSDVSPNLSSEGGAGVDDTESQQAATGLVRALHQFTSVEVLDGVNSFACKRCWRILNPPSSREKEKLRLRRLRRGKEQDESEESSDDETSSDEEEKEQKQLQDEAVSRSASIKIPNIITDGQNGKTPRPHIRPHAESINTITQESMNRSGIPTIETTSPQTPIDEMAEETIVESHRTPLLQAPKARIAQSQGLTLGDSLSSASSEEDLSDGEKEKGAEINQQKQNRRIKFGEEIPTSSSLIKSDNDQETLLLPPGKVILRKRSNHSLQRRALKRFLISETPQVFVFHFKRFQATSRGFSSYSFSNSFKKIDDYVSFPEYLDLRPWLAPPREEYNREGQLKSSSDPRALERNHREEAEDSQTSDREKKHHRWGWKSKTQSRRADEKARDVDEAKTKYRLYAVIVHQGSMSGGHYTAYVLSDHVNTATTKSSTLSSSLKTLQSQTPTAATTPVPLKEEMKSGTAVEETTTLSSGQMIHNVSHDSHQSIPPLHSAESKGNSSDTVSSASTTSEVEGTSAERKSSITSLNGKSTAIAHDYPVDSRKPSISLPKKDIRRWVYTSDTVVRGATIEEVLKAQAYMLFYEQM